MYPIPIDRAHGAPSFDSPLIFISCGPLMWQYMYTWISSGVYNIYLWINIHTHLLPKRFIFFAECVHGTLDGSKRGVVAGTLRCELAQRKKKERKKEKKKERKKERKEKRKKERKKRKKKKKKI